MGPRRMSCQSDCVDPASEQVDVLGPMQNQAPFLALSQAYTAFRLTQGLEDRLLASLAHHFMMGPRSSFLMLVSLLPPWTYL